MRTRKNHRKPLTLPGKYYAGKGSAVEVTLNDISPGGCRFDHRRQRLAAGAHIRMYIGDAGPFHALVRWVEGGQVGVTFDTPLEQGQFDHFRNCHVARAPARAGHVDIGELAEAKPHRYC